MDKIPKFKSAKNNFVLSSSDILLN